MTAAWRSRAAWISPAQRWISALSPAAQSGGGDWGSTRIFSNRLRLRRWASGSGFTFFKSNGEGSDFMDGANLDQHRATDQVILRKVRIVTTRRF
jgi:hypothetical protein